MLIWEPQNARQDVVWFTVCDCARDTTCKVLIKRKAKATEEKLILSSAFTPTAKGQETLRDLQANPRLCKCTVCWQVKEWKNREGARSKRRSWDYYKDYYIRMDINTDTAAFVFGFSKSTKTIFLARYGTLGICIYVISSIFASSVKLWRPAPWSVQ